jgi:hypothetical protein
MSMKNFMGRIASSPELERSRAMEETGVRVIKLELKSRAVLVRSSSP